MGAVPARDLSTSGIRLVGTRRFLGQKLHVLIPRDDDPTPWNFRVQILWTCAIGDDCTPSLRWRVQPQESG